MYKYLNLILRMKYHSFTRFWVRIVFLFSFFKGKFVSLQVQWLFFTVTTVDNWLFLYIFLLPYYPRVWPVVQISVIIGNSNSSLHIFTVLRLVGWKLSTRRPPCPWEDDHNDVDEHRDDDNGNNDDGHCGSVDTSTGESNGAYCYMLPFNNATIRYVVAAMVEWPRGADMIFLGNLKMDL